MDSEKLFIPVKSGFPTASKALEWARKNLPKDSCAPWGKLDRQARYFIQKY